MTLVESPLVEPKLHARAFEQSMPKRGGPRHQGTSDRMLSSIDDSHDLDNETDSDTSLKENVKSRHSLKGPSDTDQGKQSDTQHFEMANPDRSYSMWPNEYGLLQRAFGALLPDGYELDKTVSSRPWICPVRSCRRLFKVCSDLGYHFKVHHRGRRLNDNLDGTFSILNSGLVLPSEISEPPVVISRDPTNNELLVNPQRPNSKGYWVPATGEDMSVNNPDMSQESNSKHPGIAATHKSGTPETKIAADETLSVVGIEMATKDRRYTQWHDPETGMLVDMKGILVPEDYKLDYTIPGRPFICPIRSCRIACMSKKGLAKHFHNTESHTNVALNDNLDGTFSIVDSHTRERPATIVVSQNPLDPNEPPKAKPSLPPKLAKRSDHFPEVADLGSPREPSLDLTNLFPVRTLPTDPSSDPDSLWRHITSHIKDIPPYQSHEGIQYLLRLPHLRNLRPIRRLTSDLNVRQVAAVIIQATGQERDKPCTSCRRAGGPFDGCVNSSVADGIKLKGLLGSYSRACANCLYNTVANACSVKAYAPRAVGPLVPRIRRLERLERLQSSRGSLGAAADRDISMDTSTVGDGSFGERRQQSSRYSAAAAAAVDNDGTGDDENEDGMDLDEEREEAPARRQANRMSSLSETPSEPRQRRLVTLRSPRASVGAGGTGSGRLASSREVVRRRRPGVGDASSFQAQIQQQRSMPPSQDVLEMEEWELADGRIMAAGNEGNGLAFSASYLSANQMVQVSSNVTFLAITVPSGGSYRFVEDWQKTRVCSLANGKLKVQVDGEAEFVIGMNGVFRIGKGLGCVVMNRGYVDSMLHVTALVDGF
ncbi:hypothetical protein B0T17DRAFT_183052 [Bombardia bombarda]|uniref:C2H2-type domain-containing protein n=1 Tax=Bombardia bombarda TaxID=252184 RepID=A0AA39X8L1_9PEZI|nr:hypothetical protein B0T17DRAFT_183052 [Bombardia bombarda]